MSTELYLEAASHFILSGKTPVSDSQYCEPISGGLINSSFKLKQENGASLLLQKINKNVFKDPVKVQENYLQIWNHVNAHQLSLILPEPITCAPQQFLYKDSAGDYWRAFRFMENSMTCAVANTTEQAFTTAATFARFTASFSDFDTRWLHHTIPDFHNLSFRYQQMESALEKDVAGRKESVINYINEILQRVHYKEFYERITRSTGAYPLRVMHHDAKIANVLFSNIDNSVICAVDFDTVMPGYYFSDMGDMIRSMSCSLDEGSTDFDAIFIKKDIYNAIHSGYLSVMGSNLTNAELQHIHHPGLLMIYMQAMRFLTDHINGDIYYRINYEGQNLNRARNQIALLIKLEEMLVTDYNYVIGGASSLK